MYLIQDDLKFLFSSYRFCKKKKKREKFVENFQQMLHHCARVYINRWTGNEVFKKSQIKGGPLNFEIIFIFIADT